MGKKLRHMAMVLELADELYEEGNLDNKSYLRLITSVETAYKNPDGFVEEIIKWSMDLIRMDEVDNHLKNFDKVINSFLESPDADDQETRIEVLQTVQHLKALFFGIREYEQKKLILKFTSENKNG